MVTGFSSEKSAEYIILNDLYRKFEKHFAFFYPIYFHKNRDNTALSKKDNTQGLRLICLFSRRPKTNCIGSRKIYINFRDHMFFQSEFLYEHGISTIIASPIASSIIELGFGATCQWFIGFSHVEAEDNTDDDVFEKEVECTGNFIFKPANDETLIKILMESQTYTWKEILEKIERWHSAYINYVGRNIVNSYSGQKPIIIVYKLKNETILG